MGTCPLMFKYDAHSTQDADLLHIAEQALLAPLPPGWTVHLDGDGAEYFHNTETQARL